MNLEGSDFKVTRNKFVVGWVVKTVFAIMMGMGVGFAVAQALFCAHSVTMELLGSILLGGIVGAFVGIAQSNQLRHILRDPRLWAIASIAGWAIAAFLFEFNWPISRCLASSNAPGYTPGNFIKAIHDPIFIIAGRIERTIAGKTMYGGIYNGVILLLMGSLMGAVLGIPQGIGQWLVLRKEISRSAHMIWINALIWTASLFLVFIDVDLMKLIGFWSLALLPVVIVIPAAVIALMLVRLRKKQTSDQPAGNS